MPIDFRKLQTGVSADTTTSPRELFNLLPQKDPRYTYLRDVQAEVLDQWASRRTTKDLAVKMNTGSGKTIVGLLILKSCLNDGVGPAVYIAPSPYLVKQVIKEADALKIEATEDINSHRFLSGQAILVANVYKLINGLSAFGVGDRGIEIPIGSIVIDDAHACLDTAEEQFTLSATHPHGAYGDLLSLFAPDLKAQSSSGLLDLQMQDPHKTMQVPFWAWIDKQDQVQAILRKYQNDREIRFVWPLLKNYLHLCRCAFGGGRVEVTPRCLPIAAIPSFSAAQRRIFMSATFRDDSILVTHFDANPVSTQDVICPKTGGDIGDRMIIVPQEANPLLDDIQLKALFKDLSQSHNVVVIVPSEYRANFWADVAVRTLTANNLVAGVGELQTKHVGLVVLINKYDGIDLPGSACHVLVIDGLPDVRRIIDKIDQGALIGSDLVARQAIQRIEQGMGRGIRSKDDYCAVFLLGRSLTSHLYARGAINFFTSATLAQLKLSRQMVEQLKGGSIQDFKDAVESFLKRDVEWMRASRAAVVGAEYRTQTTISSAVLCERSAFNAAVISDFPTAVSDMQQAVSQEADPRIKAWLKVELAEYEHRLNPSEAQQILKSAVTVNNQLTRPLVGIQYIRMVDRPGDQASLAISHLLQAFPDPNNLVLAVNGFLDALIFAPDTAPLFERTMASVAAIIGFAGERPEDETGRGPDVLWNLGQSQFLVVECKNGATTKTINKHDCNQLTGSMQWFLEKYGPSLSATPLMVHPARIFEYAATPHPGTRIMTEAKLSAFRNALHGFSVAVSRLTRYGTPKDVHPLLNHHGLTASTFAQRYSEDFQTK